MNNPQIILAALDRHLERPTRIILHGRAGIALGYPAASADLEATVDVDAILPSVEMSAIESDIQFWRALELANRELEPHGLYMTHLFPDDQVILSPEWLVRIVPVSSHACRQLRVFRPSTLDLVLTKMMREDPQDLADIEFLLRQEPIPTGELRAAFSAAIVPRVGEIRSAFLANQPRVLSLAPP